LISLACISPSWKLSACFQNTGTSSFGVSIGKHEKKETLQTKIKIIGKWVALFIMSSRLRDNLQRLKLRIIAKNKKYPRLGIFQT
jgi:hypothetical protein